MLQDVFEIVIISELHESISFFLQNVFGMAAIVVSSTKTTLLRLGRYSTLLKKINKCFCNLDLEKTFFNEKCFLKACLANTSFIRYIKMTNVSDNFEIQFILPTARNTFQGKLC